MKNRKKGFTLTELTVVLVIMAIITAIAVPFFVKYWKLAEFRKNESNARTVYLAAESRLTWYRTSGQWEQFQKKVKSEGIKAEFDGDEYADLNGRIYTLTLDVGSYQEDSETGSAILSLLDASAYDKSFLKAAIAVEIDIETGEVYSAFYGTKCKGLNYADSDTDGYLTMKDRAYESRKGRLLGYYSAKDTANVVDLDPVRLRVTTISLLNSEKLTLNWSSNVGTAEDVSYELTFYQAGDKTKLFRLMMSPHDMKTSGWDGQSGSTSEMASFTLYDAKDQEKGSWDFPVSLSNNSYSLVLDAMMSAETLGTLEAKASDKELSKTESTSILRLAEVADVLKENQEIYATVKAVSYAGTDKTMKLTREYRDSEALTSNTADSLYGDDTKEGEVEISTWRHLSNIRYADDTKEVTYTLTAKNMDWASVGTGVYYLQADTAAETGTGSNPTAMKPCWLDNGSEVAAFPTIPELAEQATLEGKGSKTLLSNLKLSADSVLDDETVGKLYTNAKNFTEKQTRYLGLFAENNGTIEDVTFSNPTLSLVTTEKNGTTEARSLKSLQGVGILAGRSSGNLSEITVEAEKTAGTTRKAVGTDQDTIYVNLTKNGSQASVGGLVGILAKEDTTTENSFKKLGNVQLISLVMNGTMEVQLPADEADKNAGADTASVTHYGIGGIAGYAYLGNSKNEAKLTSCTNHADISGNLFTGGIVGRVDGEYQESASEITKDDANLVSCESDGLILSTAYAEEETLIGRYFGGIAGYAEKAVLYSCESASGRAKGFSYDESQKELLKGDYVGGILGFGDGAILSNCETQKNGYVLGDHYVGGIAGGMKSQSRSAIQVDGEVLATTNRSYVIGNSYVGGITGMNEAGVTLQNCINNGIAAAYDRYAGGIVGYNDTDATISDSASYVSDYDSSLYNMIVTTWKATGDYVGGIAGYNNGVITFEESSEKILVKSVSSIVAGGSYVGGIAGFNDVKGSLEAKYDLVGGRIYGSGDAVGGCFGLNASESILTKELVVKPRSVEGHYYVGGVIGANVVNLSEDVEASGLRAENSLGAIRGTAFVGGIIGYERTYTDTQLASYANGTTVSKAIREAIETAQKSADSGKRLLPSLDSNTQVPKSVLASQNTYTLTLTSSENNESSFSEDTNNIPLEAGYYAGGIVGYCEKDSKLVLKNCRNAGNISLLASIGADQGVKLENYVNSNEVGSTISASDIRMHFVGGIIGVNLENQVIDHCTNTGNMSDTTGIGGIVGLNAGYVYDCSLSGNFGNASLSYLGGIAGINIEPSDMTTKTYAKHSYTAGTIEACSTNEGRTVTGKDTIGGIAAWNLTGGVIKGSTSAANVTGAGDNVGGVAGRNSGRIELADESTKSITRTVQSGSGSAVGGIVGLNEAGGELVVTGTGSGNEVTAVGSGLTVRGSENVGGIIGTNQGNLGNEKNYLVSQAKLVRASKGNAGGIVGSNAGNITQAKNCSASVEADQGNAGGITGINEKEHTIENCINTGNVTASAGYAGGIVATNAGSVQNSTVTGTSNAKVTLKSRGVEEMGAIAAVNTGTIKGSQPTAYVTLSSSGSIFGGITGRNQGTVSDTKLTYMPELSGSGSLTVGGAVGVNEKTVSKLTSDGLSFTDFTNYRYLGGIVGQNGLETQDTNAKESSATVTESSFSGTITEKQGAAGNCYGGVAGINYGALKADKVEKIQMTIQGVYTATSTSSAEEKEALATHAGGIAGKNETGGSIEECVLTNNEKSSLTAAYGMLGGITGFNKGSISGSGSDQTDKVLAGADEKKNAEALEQINENVSSASLTPAKTYVKWDSNDPGIENMSDSNNTKVTSGRLQIMMTTNGNLGGIAAYNSTEGSLTHCVSGKWFLNNKSEAIGVGTGGIIGMNESEKDLSYLVNGAFVGRQIASGSTNRFAGGIIGNQNNSTSSDWIISYCVNYGMVYCYNSHYSGGILGQWTGSGGTIENCRNYGNLQTTYAAGWVGASGGIVAQLYHAYEDNEYNIISCGNYGNIYKQEGTSGDGANDSAGILGNITNYEASQAAASQSYSVQILDCFNAPGVEIYSNSMASGIFGFLSCDGKNQDSILTSTANVVMRIERCRNFAKTLTGGSFAGGVFGDRYGTNSYNSNSAWGKNTTVKDCYTLSLSSGYTEYPLFSNSALNYSNRSSGPDTMKSASDRKGNFYISGAWSGNTFPDITLYEEEGKQGSGPSNGDYKAYGSDNDKYGMNKGYVYPAVMIYNKTKGEYCFAEVKLQEKLDGKTNYIKDGYIYKSEKSGDTKIGKILFYIGAEEYNTTKVTNSSAQKTNDPVFVNCRESYRNLEGIMEENGEKKLLNPSKVQASIENGRIKVDVTPQILPGDNSELNANVTVCDPFAYRIKVTDENQNSYIYTIYTEQGSFAIPSDAGLSGNLTVSVQAVSMFDDVEASDWVEAGNKIINPTLPDPDVRIQLIYTGSKFAYQISLNNLEEYKDYSGWQTQVDIERVGSVILDANATSATVSVKNNTNAIYQMTAQTSMTATGNANIQSSQVVSTPISLPGGADVGKPEYQLAKNWGKDLNNGKITVSGTTLETLNIQINLTSSDSMITPPIYRAELVGDWKDTKGQVQKDTVMAQTDILTVSKGTATATFADLPEYVEDAANIRVRIWYAASGLGPVYTYDIGLDSASVDSSYEMHQLLGVTEEEDGTRSEQWHNYNSTVWARKGSNAGYTFCDYAYETATLFTWLPKPELKDADIETAMTPAYKGDKLYYTFAWDQDKNYSNAKYEVSLTGIDENENEVIISTAESYTNSSANTLTIDGSDWNYKKVRLKVTRIGYTDKSTTYIGLSSSGEYSIRPRLEAPAQPTLSIVDENELLYTLSFAKNASEDGLAGYQAYIQTYATDGSLNEAKALGEQIEAAGTAIYKTSVDLEAYAGKKVVIYLKAIADRDGDYLDSLAGITTELTIPSRLAAPNVTWRSDWNYDRSSPTVADVFRNQLRINLKANDASSIPPGGSGYLLRAYIYDSKQAAEDATTDITMPNGASFVYPMSYDTSKIPVEMTAANSSGYYHELQNLSIQYAGKWIVFYARISSGSGSVSSAWTKASAPIQLPKVQLSTPEVDSESKDVTLTATVTTTPNVPGEEKDWSAKATSLNWNSVECADLYEFTLSGTKKKNDGTTEGLTETYRILEGTNGLTVQRKTTDGNWENLETDDDTYTYTLTGYQNTVSDSYTPTGSSGGQYYYDVTLTARLVVTTNDDGSHSYQLLLSDVSDVIAKDTLADGTKAETTITGDSFKLTNQVSIKADVQANQDGNESDYYAASEASETTFQ